MRVLCWCMVFITFFLTSPRNPSFNMANVQTEFGASTPQMNMLHRHQHAQAHPYRGDEVQNPAYALIYIHTATQTIGAYDPQTDTHTPIFTCPQACYDPASDSNGRIAVVTANGFGIFDTLSGDYTPFSADFGVYGYKGGAAFRPDLAFVAYEGRFHMHMRLLLTDLSTGTTTDLHSAGVGNPSWMPDGTAIIISDGASIWQVPINGDAVTVLDIPRPDGYIDWVVPLGDDWVYRVIHPTGYALVISPGDTHSTLIEAPAIITYTISASHIASVNFDARTGDYALMIADLSASTSIIHIGNRREIVAIAIAPDSHYLAWVEESADMGFGFYDLWIADLTAPTITPIRIAEHISQPSTRPSGLTWMQKP